MFSEGNVDGMYEKKKELYRKVSSEFYSLYISFYFYRINIEDFNINSPRIILSIYK
jgi:hypothetical protein